MKKFYTIIFLITMLVIYITTPVFATDNTNGADYLIDQNNIIYIFQNGKFVKIGSNNLNNARMVGFGESSASWITHQVRDSTNRIYTVQHKGWKEMRSSSSLYGVRACSKTTCSPTKNHWTQACMTDLTGSIIYQDSNKQYSTGTAYAASPYQDCHYTNAIMRSNWGGVGTVIS